MKRKIHISIYGILLMLFTFMFTMSIVELAFLPQDLFRWSAWLFLAVLSAISWTFVAHFYSKTQKKHSVSEHRNISNVSPLIIPIIPPIDVAESQRIIEQDNRGYSIGYNINNIICSICGKTNCFHIIGGGMGVGRSQIAGIRYQDPIRRESSFDRVERNMNEIERQRILQLQVQMASLASNPAPIIISIQKSRETDKILTNISTPINYNAVINENPPPVNSAISFLEVNE